MSESESINVLKVLLGEYGFFWNDYKLSKSLLMDSFPNDKPLWRSLLSCIEEDILDEIYNSKRCSKADFHRYVNKLISSFGYSTDIAQRAVLIWVVAVGVRIDEEKTEIEQNDTNQLENKCSKPQLDESLFKYTEIVGGYAISKYVGFDEEEISIPDMYMDKPVTRIAESAFEDCSAVKKVYLGNNIKVIEAKAFYGCKNLRAVYGCENLIYLGGEAFCLCKNLSEIKITDRLYYMGMQAFAFTAITSFVVPKGIHYLSSCLFWSCTMLETIEIHDNVIALGEGCFRSCEKLKKVIIPASVKYIAADVFLNCTGLRKLIIYSIDVEFIGDNNLKQSYTWQPDMRYNPRTAYKDLDDIVVYCRPGSKAQIYCRNHNVKMERLVWEGELKERDSIQDLIGIQIDYSLLDEQTQYVFHKAIDEIEKSDQIVVEHGKNDYIIFCNSDKRKRERAIRTLFEELEKDSGFFKPVHIIKIKYLLGMSVNSVNLL